jgi:hypothetical protein
MYDMHRLEVTDTRRWINSTGLPPDGRQHFRERAQYGNRHAVFEPGADWGIVHLDEHNATDFPVGTLNHAAKYANEKTGVSEPLAKVLIAGAALYLGYRGLKSLKLL